MEEASGCGWWRSEVLIAAALDGVLLLFPLEGAAAERDGRGRQRLRDVSLGWLLGSRGQGGGGRRGKERQSVEESASCRRGSDRLIREEARTGNLI